MTTTNRKLKTRVLVVEDDPAILNGLVDVLVFHGYQVQGVEDGAEGLRSSLDGHYDLILLDLMLPNLDGLSICRAVRKAKPRQAIIMLTAKGSEGDVVEGFKAGADDYVSKPFSLRELIVRVEAILRRAGKTVGDEQVTAAGILFDGRNLLASFQGHTAELTRREMDIVVYLHQHRDRIVSKKELLKEVWGYPDPDVETRTVDIHILKLRRKITALNPESTLVPTVRGEGYRLEPVT
ncbi:MAG TPA: DNA-binding response regulator [Syntrophobacteraceae bacterium]|nr:DNA-binding response regulator [Syntrophobacteraceae bacterium]